MSVAFSCDGRCRDPTVPFEFIQDAQAAFCVEFDAESFTDHVDQVMS